MRVTAALLFLVSPSAKLSPASPHPSPPLESKAYIHINDHVLTARILMYELQIRRGAGGRMDECERKRLHWLTTDVYVFGVKILDLRRSAKTKAGARGDSASADAHEQ